MNKFLDEILPIIAIIAICVFSTTYLITSQIEESCKENGEYKRNSASSSLSLNIECKVIDDE